MMSQLSRGEDENIILFLYSPQIDMFERFSILCTKKTSIRNPSNTLYVSQLKMFLKWILKVPDILTWIIQFEDFQNSSTEFCLSALHILIWEYWCQTILVDRMICTKSSSTYYIVEVFHGCSVETTRNLLTTFVRPILEFVDPDWDKRLVTWERWRTVRDG